jgi:hypothetical protein
METRSQPRRGITNRVQPKQASNTDLMTQREAEEETAEEYEARLIKLDRAAAEALMRLAGVS